MRTIIHRLGERNEEGRGTPDIQDLDPSDQRNVIASYGLQSADQVRELVEIVASSRSWRATPTIERGVILLRTSQYLRDNKESFALTISSENGKTVREATIEVEKSADFFEFYGGLARSPQGHLLADWRPNTYARVLSEPLGLVLAICPWNDPLLTPARKLAPALSSGNSVLLKPASDTPLAALLLEEALLASGLPPSALGVLICDHQVVQHEVLENPRLAAVTFTGSTAVGTKLRQGLAERNVRIQTEMGGKNAAIVMGDADLSLATAAVIAGAFGQSGQRCTATSRLIVSNDIYEDFLETLTAGIADIRIGPATDADTVMGPLVAMSQRAEVEAHVVSAIEDGEHLLWGGHVPEGPKLNHGCFFEPTLLGGTRLNSAIWHEEVFGPVLVVRTVDSLGEALAAANGAKYGLAAAIFTSSLESAERAIAELDVGQVSVNLPTTGWDVHQPFGGFKESGSAFKEQGSQGLQFYVRWKTSALRFA